MKKPFLLPALIAGFGLIPADRVTAQAFTTLHTFAAISGPISGPFTNSDGAQPKGLFSSGNTLYGTAESHGPSATGTIFKVNTDGTGFTILHSFTAQGPDDPNKVINSDGGGPSDLVLSVNTLYGTASYGGSSGWGTVFAVNTDGTGFTTLHSFTFGSDRGGPEGRLILSGNTLYGTARGGTVFALNTDGTGFTTLYSFTDGGSDGRDPNDLVLSGNTLYGTAKSGGSSSYGTVFAVNTDGTDFTTLHSFTARSTSSPFTNSDGFHPFAGLILLGNTLYGTAQEGGSSGAGTVFALNTDGTGFTTLHSFTAGNLDSSNYYTNSDGASPSGELVLSGHTLYGTAEGGGRSGSGTIFSLSFRPQLTITPSGADVIFTWPTNVAGFDYTGYILQSTTNLVSPAVWTAVSPGPVVIDGQNAVTNLISGTQQFYRLSQ